VAYVTSVELPQEVPAHSPSFVGSTAGRSFSSESEHICVAERSEVVTNFLRSPLALKEYLFEP